MERLDLVDTSEWVEILSLITLHMALVGCMFGTFFSLVKAGKKVIEKRRRR